DEARIDVDDQGARLGKNRVERDRAAPPEGADKPFDMSRDVGQRKTLLDRRPAADAFPDPDIGMEGDEASVVGERLDHGEAPESRLLGDEGLPAEAQS